MYSRAVRHGEHVYVSGTVAGGLDGVPPHATSTRRRWQRWSDRLRLRPRSEPVARPSSEPGSCWYRVSTGRRPRGRTGRCWKGSILRTRRISSQASFRPTLWSRSSSRRPCGNPRRRRRIALPAQGRGSPPRGPPRAPRRLYGRTLCSESGLLPRVGPTLGGAELRPVWESAHSPCRGSKASRSPSPRTFRARIVRVMASWNRHPLRGRRRARARRRRRRLPAE